MRLRPCEHCRRHVAVDELRCPFCSHALARVGRLGLVVPGRFSRAAVFASATLVSGCASSSAKHETIEHEQVESKPQAPPPAGTLRGFVRNAQGVTQPGYRVILQYQLGRAEQTYATTSDANGRFEFTNLLPGTYVLSYQTNTREGQAGGTGVTLGAEVGARQDITIDSSVPDRGPCCKPYGAPPARRRIV